MCPCEEKAVLRVLKYPMRKVLGLLGPASKKAKQSAKLVKRSVPNSMLAESFQVVVVRLSFAVVEG